MNNIFINNCCVLHRAKNVQTMEELRDVYQHFLLYYGTDIPRMKAQQRQVRRKAREEDGEEGEEEETQEPDGLKQASRKTGYSICVQAGLGTYSRLYAGEKYCQSHMFWWTHGC